MTGRAVRGWVTAATAGYLTNAAFGTLVATGVVDNSRITWVHHALFITTASLTVPAVGVGLLRRRSVGIALAPATLTLAALPYAGGRLRRHATLAATAAPSYLTALVLAWRKD